jgi:cystathionine beta-lyase
MIARELLPIRLARPNIARPMDPLKPATLVTTLGRDPETQAGAVNPPVYRASTVLYPTLDALQNVRREHGRMFYGRYGTPTTFALQDAIAALEGAHATIVVSSGAAAIATCLLAFVAQGDHVLLADNVYEPSRRFARVLERFGVSATFYDPRIGAGIEALITTRTRAILVEAPGSLTFEMPDVRALAAAARARGVVSIMDNTWATPLYCKPLSLGFDVSVQAATKYIGGHSDLMMGVISANQATFETVRAAFIDLGQHVSPEDCSLALRGLRTLAVRLARHFETGVKLAQWLAARPEVVRVLHPALPEDPGHALWQRDFTGASGLFSAVLRPTSRRGLAAFVDGLELFGMGYSWGGFESLALPSDPAKTRSVVPWQAPGPLIRFHAGLEDPRDLIADLDAAFARRAAAEAATEPTES